MPARKHETDVKLGKFVIRWTGWKPIPATILITGEWAALDGEGYYYSSVDGNLGKVDQVTSPFANPSGSATIFTNATAKARLKQAALARLIEYISYREGKHAQ
jgi:hypothetical protein